jgi:uncharacterized caspase-like protein
MSHRALLIGVASYRHDRELPILRGPVADVAALRDALTHSDRGLHSTADVQIITDGAQSEILTAVEDFFAVASKQDTLLLFFSGHGRLDASGDLYLCATDTDPDRLVATGVGAHAVNQVIRNSRVTRAVIVLDCCYAGAFTFRSGEVPTQLDGAGRFVLACCQRRELAVDPSPFTAALIEGLRTGEADVDNDGLVSIEDLYRFVRPKLEHLRQRPQRQFHMASGDVILGRGVAGTATAATSESASRRHRTSLVVSAVVAASAAAGITAAIIGGRSEASPGPVVQATTAAPQAIEPDGGTANASPANPMDKDASPTVAPDAAAIAADAGRRPRDFVFPAGPPR